MGKSKDFPPIKGTHSGMDISLIFPIKPFTILLMKFIGATIISLSPFIIPLKILTTPCHASCQSPVKTPVIKSMTPPNACKIESTRGINSSNAERITPITSPTRGPNTVNIVAAFSKRGESPSPILISIGPTDSPIFIKIGKKKFINPPPNLTILSISLNNGGVPLLIRVAKSSPNELRFGIISINVCLIVSPKLSI